MVPGLVLLLGLSQHRAFATSLAIIVVSATTAGASFAIDGEVDWATAGTVFLGSGAGAFLAARLLHRVPAVLLARAFVVLVLIAAARIGLFP